MEELRPDDPWVLHVVVRAERAAERRPEHHRALEAVAAGVLAFLHDDRATMAGGPWHDAVSTWRATNIRKIARRARGAAWERAASLAEGGAGIVLQQGLAEVAVLQPTLRSATPSVLEPLQVGGLELDAVAHAPDLEAPVLVLLAPLGMSTGKAAAQVGHAAQLAAEALQRKGGPDALAVWAAAGWRTAVRTASSADEVERAVSGGRSLAVVRDAGFTEVPPGSTTAVAVVGPGS